MTGSALHAAERPIRLRALLALHRRERHPLELPDVLGDGALLNRLPPLLNVRRALLRYGFSFAPASQIGGIHSMFPTMELIEILRTRTIPYRRTALAARRVLEGEPNLSLPTSLFRDICVASYTFHEGAHAIFHETACAGHGELRGRRLVETLIGSEAFAIAFEQLVALKALFQARRSTTLFLAANAYVNPLDFRRLEKKSPGAGRRLARMAENAPAEVMTLLAATNLIGLLRPNAAAGRAGFAERLSRYAGLSPERLQDAELLVATGFHVDFDFRGRTQRNFFGYLGLEADFEALLAQPLEQSLAADSAFSACLASAISQVLGDGMDFPR